MWENSQFSADLLQFSEDILNKKLIVCSDYLKIHEISLFLEK